MVVQIKETDCLFKVVDDQTGPRAIVIQPRTGGWVMWLNLKAGRTTLEEAEKLAAQLQERVLHVTAGANEPFVWVESPGSETKQ
jgi:hypothetical protein